MKTVVLFSSGIDSFLTADYLNQRQIEYKKIYFNLNSIYSQPEKYLLMKIYDDIDYCNMLDISRIEENDLNVPNRNLILTTLAASIHPDVETIYINVMKDDRSIDTSKELFESYSPILSKSVGHNIEIKSLFWDMEKSQVIKQYMEYGRNRIALVRNTFSCFGNSYSRKQLDLPIYESRGDRYTYVSTVSLIVPVCMSCKACFRKVCALTMANLYIPFENSDILIQYETEMSELVNYPNRLKTIKNYLNFMRDYNEGKVFTI